MDADAVREALTTAMLNSTAPMVLCDPHLPDCPMIVVNRAFADLTGYDPIDITGQNCRFLQGPKTDPSAPRRIRACLEAGQGCIEWVVNYRRNGTEFWNLLFISPVYGPDGALLFFFGNQFDITRGFPNWMVDVQLGRAHVVPALESEFHALLEEITLAERVQALERIVAAAHRLAEISVSLAPGTLEDFKRRA